MARYFTGAVRFIDGRLAELAVYPIDPDPELEALGHMQMDYIVDAEDVINGIKQGDVYLASFHGSKYMPPLEVVVREGLETLEIADVGQPEAFKTLRNLPAPG